MTERHAPAAEVSHLHTIFLCGPITGIPGTTAKDWRRQATNALMREARIIDPTRDVLDSRRHSDESPSQRVTAERLLHGKGTVARNMFDIRRSDLVLACFLGAKAVSIGAVGEIFWANAFRKPVIIVRENANIHNHDMLNELAGWIFEDLDAALTQVRRLLSTSI